MISNPNLLVEKFKPRDIKPVGRWSKISQLLKTLSELRKEWSETKDPLKRHHIESRGRQLKAQLISNRNYYRKELLALHMEDKFTCMVIRKLI